MKNVMNLLTCIFEIIIFDAFFKEILKRKLKRFSYIIVIYFAIAIMIIYINSFNNSILNLFSNFMVYFIFSFILFDGLIKEKLFCFIVFYTVFAGVEIIFEFTLSLILGEQYCWYSQMDILKLVIICLEKLMTFIILFVTKKHLNKEEYGMDNKLLIYSLILPIATFWLYGALLYSGWMMKISGINEVILIIGCTLLLLSNIVIFLIYDYVFLLNKKKQKLEMMSLKTDMEKKYYDRMEAVNIQHSYYMHDLNFLLKTIGNLAIQEQNKEITSVIQNMKIRIGEMENDFFCRNKILNTILCEKKREANNNSIRYSANVEPGINLNFLQDIDIIIIMGNIIDNAIEASKKEKDSFIDINIFTTQKGHFLMLRIENKYSGVLKRYGETFYSTKDEPGKHGMGIRNVRNCIEKYGGYLQINTEKNLFTVSIVFTIF